MYRWSTSIIFFENHAPFDSHERGEAMRALSTSRWLFTIGGINSAMLMLLFSLSVKIYIYIYVKLKLKKGQYKKMISLREKYVQFF